MIFVMKNPTFDMDIKHNSLEEKLATDLNSFEHIEYQLLKFENNVFIASHVFSNKVVGILRVFHNKNPKCIPST